MNKAKKIVTLLLVFSFILTMLVGAFSFAFA